MTLFRLSHYGPNCTHISIECSEKRQKHSTDFSKIIKTQKQRKELLFNSNVFKVYTLHQVPAFSAPSLQLHLSHIARRKICLITVHASYKRRFKYYEPTPLLSSLSRSSFLINMFRIFNNFWSPLSSWARYKNLPL